MNAAFNVLGWRTVPKSKAPAAAPVNRLLARLPPEKYQRLRPHLKLVPLEFKHVLYEAQSSIDYAYFPNSGVVLCADRDERRNHVNTSTVRVAGYGTCGHRPLLMENSGTRQPESISSEEWKTSILPMLR